jgi:iron complex transport system permease protein
VIAEQVAPEAVRAAAPRRRWIGGELLIPLLLVGVVAAAVVAAGKGAYGVPPGEVLAAIGRRLGLLGGEAADPVADQVLWEIRFPRVCLALLVGASLGCAGAAMQGSFSNPLAEPGLVGVSSGAVLGAAAQIVLGVHLLGSWTITAFAFGGGLVTVLLVYTASREGGRTEVVTLVLTGIAVNAFTGAVIGLITYFSDDAELRSITFWNLGSMAAATWSKVAVVAPVAGIGLVVAVACARRLDLLALGEREARHLGVDVERLRVVLLTTVALLAAASVAVSGVVLFVGLVVPHLVRMLAGPGHRVLLPASALGGALILVLADLASRTIAAPAEIPLGVLTSLVGSPFFFWLLRRTRARQGGWA